MAFPLQNWTRADVLIGNEPVSVGSIERPATINTTGNKYFLTETIANGANAVVYNSSLTAFTYLYIASDFDTRMKLTDTGSNTFSVTLRGTNTEEKYGIPFQLGADETVNTATTLNTIQIFNTSGNTAKVKILVVE